MRLLAVLLIAAASAGCAVGNKHGYIAARPELAVQGTRSVAVAAQDARPYVVSGNKTPDFVGLQRGGFGNPFDVTTESEKPLADDFAATIAQSLERKGFKSTTVKVAPAEARADPRALVANAKTERLALVFIREWKSDTYTNTALLYDVTLYIYDGAGAELAANRITGRDNLGGNALNPPGHAKEAVPAAYSKKLEELFASDAVVKSLR
jgi:hypothetical protein